ncbi:hypothetical protein MRX96_040678 [Rhipicephalus microplus]
MASTTPSSALHLSTAEASLQHSAAEAELPETFSIWVDWLSPHCGAIRDYLTSLLNSCGTRAPCEATVADGFALVLEAT